MNSEAEDRLDVLEQGKDWVASYSPIRSDVLEMETAKQDRSAAGAICIGVLPSFEFACGKLIAAVKNNRDTAGFDVDKTLCGEIEARDQRAPTNCRLICVSNQRYCERGKGWVAFLMPPHVTVRHFA